MKLVDANLLLYAVDETSQHHVRAKEWLDKALSGNETVLLPWVSLLAFLRISTHSRVFAHPLSIETAAAVVDAWLSQPQAIVPEPDSGHARRIRELLVPLGQGGNLVNDAHLAALALQYDAEVVTFDNDFDRFAGVRWQMPGADAERSGR